MKRLISAALLVVAGFGIAACGDHSATPAPSSGSSSGAAQELNSIQTTLDAIDSESASDPN